VIVKTISYGLAHAFAEKSPAMGIIIPERMLSDFFGETLLACPDCV
jgi:hypothetical protein